jgi:hypothetical protein
MPASDPHDISKVEGVYGKEQVNPRWICLIWDYNTDSVRLAQLDPAGIRKALFSIKEKHSDLTEFDILLSKTEAKDKNGRTKSQYSATMDRATMGKFHYMNEVVAFFQKMGTANLENYWSDGKIFDKADADLDVDEFGVEIADGSKSPPIEERSIKEIITMICKQSGITGNQVREASDILNLPKASDMNAGQLGELMAYLCAQWAEANDGDGAQANGLANQVSWFLPNAWIVFNNEWDALQTGEKPIPIVEPAFDDDF